MPKKSLAEIRSQPVKSDERRYTVVVGAGREFVSRIQSLQDQIQRAALDAAQRPRKGSDDAPAPPGKTSDGKVPAAVKALQAELAKEVEAMADYEGELLIRAVWDEGQWRRWCLEHPARDEDEPGYELDQDVTGGHCNADDLIDALSQFVISYDDQPLTDGDWEALNLSGADRRHVATIVTAIYVSDGPDLPNWRRGLSAMLTNAAA